MLKLYENIKTLRKEKGMTQGELAKLAGYTDRSTIAKIECGKIDLSQSKIAQFADIFDVTAGELMGWTEETYNTLSDLAHEMYTKEPSATDDEGYPESVQKLIDFAKAVPEDRAEAMLQMMQALSAQFDKMAQTQQADS